MSGYQTNFGSQQTNHEIGPFKEKVMFAKLLLWVWLLYCNQDVGLHLNQDIHWSIGNVGKTASMSMLTLFKSRYTLKGRYSIGNVGKTASMSVLTLFESRYTLKGRYNIGNVGKTASMSMLALWIKIYINAFRLCVRILTWKLTRSLNYFTFLKSDITSGTIIEGDQSPSILMPEVIIISFGTTFRITIWPFCYFWITIIPLMK